MTNDIETGWVDWDSDRPWLETVDLSERAVGQAICRQVADPDLWFPEKGGGTKLPKLLCQLCPVKAACLKAAIDNHVEHGIWGGLSAIERRPLYRHPEQAESDAA